MGDDRELGRLLAETRRALVAGDLEALPALGAALEAALGAAGAPPRADAQRLRELREAAARNLALLAAARRGVTTARRHFEEISGLAAPATYDASGRRAALPPPLSGRLRRA